MPPPKPQAKTTRLNRDRVLRTAVQLADREGVETVSMRKLADHLGVVPMALYKHVANKDELLQGMVDVIIEEIEPQREAVGTWKTEVRWRILSTREAMLRHPWARRVIEARTSRSVVVLAYLDSVAGLFLAGGLSPDLIHHAMHAIGSRVWGFTQDVFDDPNPSAATPLPIAMSDLEAAFPSLISVAGAVSHDTETVIGPGCDDQFEFEFALDLLLEGIERRHGEGWRSSG